MTNLAMKFMMSLLLLALFMEIIHAMDINQPLLEKDQLTDSNTTYVMELTNQTNIIEKPEKLTDTKELKEKVLHDLAEINQPLIEKEKLTDSNTNQTNLIEKKELTTKELREKIVRDIDVLIPKLKDMEQDMRRIRICKERIYKVLQLVLDTTNCILPAFMFFDKAAILVWTGSLLRFYVRPLPAVLKLIPSSILMITNSVLVHKSLEEFKNLIIESGEGGEMFGENSAFEMSLFPNSDGARAAIIVLPFLSFVSLEWQNYDIENQLPKPTLEKQFEESRCTTLLRQLCMIANMFLPAFLPAQLFSDLFPFAALQTVLRGGGHAEEALLALNIWFFSQYQTAEMVPGQLVASFILFGIWILFFVILGCCKP